MFDEIIDDVKSSMDKAIESLNKDLQRVRTGRANLIMLDPIRVDYYGTKTPLNQVAALAVADARTITIKPWEKPLFWMGTWEKPNDGCGKCSGSTPSPKKHRLWRQIFVKVDRQLPRSRRKHEQGKSPKLGPKVLEQLQRKQRAQSPSRNK